MNTTPVTRCTELFPLLMNFTPATPVEERDGNEKVLYDEIKEIVYDTRTIGTKSLKHKQTKYNKSSTGCSIKPDEKVNLIDDKKTVK